MSLKNIRSNMIGVAKMVTFYSSPYSILYLFNQIPLSFRDYLKTGIRKNVHIIEYVIVYSPRNVNGCTETRMKNVKRSNVSFSIDGHAQ